MTPEKKTRPDFQVALAAAIVLRIFFSAAAAALSLVLHPDPRIVRSNALIESSPAGGWLYAWLGVWQRFDTLWYLRIARHGYDRNMAVIFYPLYPAAVHLTSWLMAPLAAALFVSTVAAFFYILGLLRLAEPDLTAAGSRYALLFLLAWPTSFILFAGYAEALAAALIVWAVAFARSQRWWPAAACGFLAGLARPSGVLVAVPLLVLAWKARRPAAFAVLAVPLGTLAYWAWLHWSGRPSVAAAYGLYQGTPISPPWDTLLLSARMIAHGDTLLAIKIGLVFLALVLSLQRGIGSEDKLFAVATVVQMFLYTGRPLIGGARYALIVYPAFLGWGLAAQNWKPARIAFYASALGLLNLAWMWAFFNWSLVL